VVVLDDLHWAEPTLLDLVEEVAGSAEAAPLLLVGTARPELLDQRPGWGGGLDGRPILLEPLGVQACGRLVGNLLGDHRLPEEALAAIAEAAGANADETFTTAPPPPSAISGMACFMVRKGPLRLTRTTSSKFSSVSSASGATAPSTPAQLNRASRRP
jgi:hypothetical protein